MSGYRGYGRHIYEFDVPTGTGWMYIEFTAGRGHPKRHLFWQQDDDVFELIRFDYNNPRYTNEARWSPQSPPHENEGKVLLKKANIQAREASASNTAS